MRALIIEKRVQNLSRLTTCSSYKSEREINHTDHCPRDSSCINPLSSSSLLRARALRCQCTVYCSPVCC